MNSDIERNRTAVKKSETELATSLPYLITSKKNEGGQSSAHKPLASGAGKSGENLNM